MLVLLPQLIALVHQVECFDRRVEHEARPLHVDLDLILIHELLEGLLVLERHKGNGQGLSKAIYY